MAVSKVQHYDVDLYKIKVKGNGLIDIDAGTIELGGKIKMTGQNTFRFSNCTTAQRNALAPANGDTIYNTTTNKFQGYENNGWTDLAGGGGGGSSITVQDEGSSLSAAATTLNFVGSGVTASGTGGTKTITITNSTRGNVSTTTSSIANNVSGNYNITGFKSYALISITTSHAAWVRIYANQSSRTADSSRTELTDPAPDAGVIAEVITTGAQTVMVSPGVFGYNAESTVTSNIPIRLKNKSGSTAAITVTLSVLQLEY